MSRIVPVARTSIPFVLRAAAISFLADADPTHSPTMLVSVARASGIIVETANDGTVPVPASIGWATPCPTLPPLRTAHLVYEPVGRAGDVALTEGNEIVLVSAPAADQARQDIPVLFGISGATAGTTGLSLHLTSFPPGGNSNAHMHVGYETAICGVRGAAELVYGERLERSVVITEGSFCFIPPGLPHKAYNLSETEGAQFVTARNDPADQEHVVVTPEADDGSADDRVRRSRARHAAGGLDSSL